MMRSIVLAGMIMAMVCLGTLPANADEVSPDSYLTLDDTLWDLQNEIDGLEQVGFYEDNIYACIDAAFTLCLPLPYSEYEDYIIISSFNWEISGDIIEVGFTGIAFPILGIGFLMTDDGDFSMLIKSDNDWNPYPF